MRIDNSTSGSIQGSDIASAKKAEKTEKSSAPKRSLKSEGAAAGSAKTEISSKAKEMSKAREVAAAAPDTREEKIAELKKRITEGRYQVDAKAVADRMVDEHLTSGIG